MGFEERKKEEKKESFGYKERKKEKQVNRIQREAWGEEELK